MKLNKLFKMTLGCVLLISLTACSSHVGKNQLEVNEKLYVSTKNYSQLIDLYRNKLKAGKLTEQEKNLYRYKLSSAYFNNKDYDSALLYVEPLLSKADYKQRAMGLKLKSLVQKGESKTALTVAKKYISLYPNVADAYNSQGIAYAQLGDLNNAKISFNMARQFFLNDTVAINNLAMIYILEGQYRNAVNMLLPQYLNGQREQRILHNLVFALVKTNDITYARQIIEREELNTNPDALINALKSTKRVTDNVISRMNF